MLCIKTVAMKSNSKCFLWTLLIAASTCVFFLPALQGEFLHWDDRLLFIENPYYRGLSPSHWQWMCTTVLLGHWQPLSWLSYALDLKVWGMNPQGWHAVNLLIHTGNAVLVYLLCLVFGRTCGIKRGAGNPACGEMADEGVCLTGKGRVYFPAALAALFWAVHPLRVEAVAWLSTRGYLLCGTFCLLTVLFYLRAIERKRYPLVALLCFTFATFTKGIGMMLPLVLLLMDWVSLRRITSVRTAFFCAVEKIPFFTLSLLTGVTAFFAKQTDGGMVPVEQYGPVQRMGQAIYGIWFYLLKIVSPLHLSPLYTRRPGVGAVMTVLVLTAAAAIFLFLFRRKLLPIIGTFGAFLLLIFPMLGITQSGAQLFADRFTYLAAIPFSILLGAGLAGLRAMRRTVYGATAALLFVFGVQTFVYSTVWHDDLALWHHAVAQDENSAHAYGGMGEALRDCRAYEEALEYLNKALLLQPDYADALQNRALTRIEIGEYEEALSDANKALALEKQSQVSRAKMLIGRGQIAENLNRPEQALTDYSAVIDDLKVAPFWKMLALQVRARLYLERGNLAKGAADLEAILKLPDPDPAGGQWRKARRVLAEIKKIPGE